MPCCSFLFWWCAWGYIGRKKFLLEKVDRIFESSDLLFEKFMHILENPAMILENPGFIRTSECHIRKKLVLLENRN